MIRRIEDNFYNGDKGIKERLLRPSSVILTRIRFYTEVQRWDYYSLAMRLGYKSELDLELFQQELPLIAQLGRVFQHV